MSPKHPTGSFRREIESTRPDEFKLEDIRDFKEFIPLCGLGLRAPLTRSGNYRGFHFEVREYINGTCFGTITIDGEEKSLTSDEAKNLWQKLQPLADAERARKRERREAEDRKFQ